MVGRNVAFWDGRWGSFATTAGVDVALTVVAMAFLAASDRLPEHFLGVSTNG